MHQPSGRHRRPRRTLAGQAWAIAATLLAAALTYVLIPQTPKRERAALPPAPDHPRLPAAAPAPLAPPAAPKPTRLSREPGGFPDRRAWVASARDTSTRWANGYREAAPDEDAGPLARPYMPPRPEPRPLVPRPRMPEGDLLATPPQDPPRPSSDPSGPLGVPGAPNSPSARNNPDNLDDLAAVIRTYLAVIG